MNSFPSEQDKKRLAGLVAYPYRLIVLFVAVGEVVFVTSHIFECFASAFLLDYALISFYEKAAGIGNLCQFKVKERAL